MVFTTAQIVGLVVFVLVLFVVAFGLQRLDRKLMARTDEPEVPTPASTPDSTPAPQRTASADKRHRRHGR